MANLLYMQVAEDLGKDIRGGDAPVGTMLPSERALAAKYHVSRNVIRQALSHLAQQNLIELRPGQGAFIVYCCDEKIIATIRRMLLAHQSSFLDALEVREALELAIIQKCIPYVTETSLAPIEDIWDKMEQFKKERKTEHFLQQDVFFHEQIAKLIPNSMFLLLLQTVFSITPHNFFDLSRTLDTAFQDTQQEHRAILDGLKNRDTVQACQALQTHMEHIRSDLASLRRFIS